MSDTATTPVCECPVAGYCSRYRREMLGRMYDICRGQTNLKPEKMQAYRDLWSSQAQGQPSVSQINPTPADFPCPHRGAFLEIGTCNLCGSEKGQPFDVYGCDVHGKCSIGRKHKSVKNCIACSDRLDLVEALEKQA